MFVKTSCCANALANKHAAGQDSTTAALRLLDTQHTPTLQPQLWHFESLPGLNTKNKRKEVSTGMRQAMHSSTVSLRDQYANDTEGRKV